jgi:NAD(P)-dependent dehydrogenase (short-subunit alcohol dehydrogenase family)
MGTTTYAPLDGRRALITGASRGIGADIAISMARAGAQVVLASRGREALEKVADAIANEGASAEVATVDLCDLDDVARLVQSAGDIDVLVNNAAGAESFAASHSRLQDDWNESMTLAVWAPLALIRGVVPGMIERGNGSIINISSIITRTPLPGMGPYAVAKSALETLTRVLALELAEHGVRCNAIAPGIVGTELVESTVPTAMLEQMLAGVPAGRLVLPEEVSAAAVWLASSQSASITGHSLVIDGGSSAGRFARAPKLPTDG